MGRALGGWQTSGVLTVQSGAPFSVLDSGGGTALQLDGGSSFTPGFAPRIQLPQRGHPRER